MGITGLYKWLDSIKRPTHIRTYHSLTLGIDTYSWLHKGAFLCAYDLVMDVPTTRYIDFILERIALLQHNGVTPYLVFDGDYLPSKGHTEVSREERRAESKKRGLELLAEGKKKEGMEVMQKAVDITPAMARAVIEQCRALGIECVVAPYEADAQLYYLEKIGVIDGVISEDSDLLVFGVKRLITKLDRFGDCVELNREDFTRNRDISLAGWSDAEFRMMAILSGCDYLPSIRGIGVKKAHGYVRAHKSVERIVRAIRMEGRMAVPPDYLEKFRQAELTFLHQRVWCPKSQLMVMCNEPDEPLAGEALVFIGGVVEPEIAKGVARGDLDPITKLPFAPAPAVVPVTPVNVAKAYPHSGPCITARPQPIAKSVSIATFFPKASTSTSTPRTPLVSKSTNIQAIRKAFTAPRPSSSSSGSSSSFSSCPPKKRAAEEVRMETPVKRRIVDENVNVKVSGERSAFFTTPKHLQSRRPLVVIPVESPTVKKTTPSVSVTSITAKTPTAKKPIPQTSSVPSTSAIDTDLEKAIAASLQPAYLPDTNAETGVQKVARSLKANFTKSAGNVKIAKFVEKQRVSAVTPRAITGARKSTDFLQQFRRTVSGAKMQIPHTVGVGEESQDSAVGGDSQGVSLDVAVGAESGESQESEAESQPRFGKSLDLQAFRAKQ